ncbi:redoxin domain-containing protein [Endozoicomonas sp. SM1973]|uniref:Redoxin domain-containing protein n=1 Tax=Spartinivicinus marinus TaxID=2994442 RepID=A0A853I4K6_9GAMM|nr:redoxin domain-containing protein [Spartinivicinus marinus]MCX4029866.1 redoxin domain-containing protein [Spartinivicinus marinus]NYZ64891.1 redoxin domain-containing protein [Spartinivicinus marinus]
MTHYRKAPELIVDQWLNTQHPLSLAKLKGKVVVVFAFQMLCPGCVEHSLPQAKRVRETFTTEDVEVIGLHTVFEHHEAMGKESLKAFLHEYRIKFPVAIDQPGIPSPIPQTMATYQMQGTPTLLLIDRDGNLRRQFFGQAPDMPLGAEIMALVKQETSTIVGNSTTTDHPTVCTPEGCR